MKETPFLLPKGGNSPSPPLSLLVFYSLLIFLAFAPCPHLSVSLLPSPCLHLCLFSKEVFEHACVFAQKCCWKLLFLFLFFFFWSNKMSNKHQTCGGKGDVWRGAKKKNTLCSEQALQRVALCLTSRGYSFTLTHTHRLIGPLWVRGHCIYKALGVQWHHNSPPVKREEWGGWDRHHLEVQ